MNLKIIDYFSLIFILINLQLLFFSDQTCTESGCAYFYVLFALPNFLLGIFSFFLFRKIDFSPVPVSVSPITESELNEYRIIKNSKIRSVIYSILNLNLVFHIVFFIVFSFFNTKSDILLNINNSFLFSYSRLLVLPWLMIPVEFIKLKNIQGSLSVTRSVIKVLAYVFYISIWLIHTYVNWTILY